MKLLFITLLFIPSLLMASLDSTSDAFYSGNYRLAIETAARHAARFPDDSPQVARSLSWIGNSYARMGDHAEAYRAHSEGLRIAELNQVISDVLAAYNNLANLFRQNNDLVKADSLFKLMAEIALENGEDRYYLMALNNLADLEISRDNYQIALDYCDKGLVYTQKELIQSSPYLLLTKVECLLNLDSLDGVSSILQHIDENNTVADEQLISSTLVLLLQIAKKNRREVEYRLLQDRLFGMERYALSTTDVKSTLIQLKQAARNSGDSTLALDISDIIEEVQTEIDTMSHVARDLRWKDVLEEEQSDTNKWRLVSLAAPFGLMIMIFIFLKSENIRKKFLHLDRIYQDHRRRQKLLEQEVDLLNALMASALYYLANGGILTHEKYISLMRVAGVYQLLLKETKMSLSPSNFQFTPGSGASGTLTWTKGDLAYYTKLTIRDQGQPVSSGIEIYHGTGTTCPVVQKEGITQIVWGISQDANQNEQGQPVETEIEPYVPPA